MQKARSRNQRNTPSKAAVNFSFRLWSELISYLNSTSPSLVYNLANISNHSHSMRCRWDSEPMQVPPLRTTTNSGANSEDKDRGNLAPPPLLVLGLSSHTYNLLRTITRLSRLLVSQLHVNNMEITRSMQHARRQLLPHVASDTRFLQADPGERSERMNKCADCCQSHVQRTFMDSSTTRCPPVVRYAVHVPLLLRPLHLFPFLPPIRASRGPGHKTPDQTNSTGFWLWIGCAFWIHPPVQNVESPTNPGKEFVLHIHTNSSSPGLPRFVSRLGGFNPTETGDTEMRRAPPHVMSQQASVLPHPFSPHNKVIRINGMVPQAQLYPGYPIQCSSFVIPRLLCQSSQPKKQSNSLSHAQNSSSRGFLFRSVGVGSGIFAAWKSSEAKSLALACIFLGFCFCVPNRFHFYNIEMPLY
ncbi:hypothetical protein ACRALDRAFT_209815 [Sodiomyces alcalophilus JCM 7366]|uniref:uncharacterized protein n=1 Tax=Sodiomyces alcalophilus JCM 7366 TaxID=591952 RepID=UPI0039B3D0C1